MASARGCFFTPSFSVETGEVVCAKEESNAGAEVYTKVRATFSAEMGGSKHGEQASSIFGDKFGPLTPHTPHAILGLTKKKGALLVQLCGAATWALSTPYQHSTPCPAQASL